MAEAQQLLSHTDRQAGPRRVDDVGRRKAVHGYKTLDVLIVARMRMRKANGKI